MSNNLQGLFETLVVPAATSAAQAPKFRNILMEQIFTDYKSTYGTVGQTTQINIPIVNENNVNNIGNGPVIISDLNHTPTTLVINQNLSDACIIKSFDSIRTPLDLKSMYMDARVEEVLRKTNRAIANLITAANFSTYSTITGGTNTFTRANLSSGWTNLQGAGAPFNPNDVFFTTDHVAYGSMISDTSNTGNFVQQFVVGTDSAEMAARTARLMDMFQAQLDFDQQMPLPSAKHTGLFFHRYAIGAVPVLQPPTDSPTIMETTIYPRGNWPFRVQMWQDPMQQGYVIHINTVFALAVVRPEFGSFMVSA